VQRGFKSRCEQISKRYRKKLGISLEDALPYQRLAEELGVLLWAPGDVPGLDAESIHQLTVVDSRSWSAVAVKVGVKYAVIFNSAHSERRNSNNVVHELAHIILDHNATRVDVSEDGHLWLSTYGREQEDEANWLSGSLLLPREGLLAAYRRYRNLEAVASQFQVSRDLVRWRCNTTGVSRQISAAWR
jgi:hypothetical protein